MNDSGHVMHLFLAKNFNKKLIFQHIFEHQSMQHQKDKKHTPAASCFGANIIHSLMSYKKMAIEFFVQLQNCLMLLCLGTGWRPF